MSEGWRREIPRDSPDNSHVLSRQLFTRSRFVRDFEQMIEIHGLLARRAYLQVSAADRSETRVRQSPREVRQKHGIARTCIGDAPTPVL